MSTDIVLTADEMTSISKYAGIFSVLNANMVLETVNAKNWFAWSSSSGSSTILPLPASTRKRYGFRFMRTVGTASDLFDVLDPAGSVQLTIGVRSTGAIYIDSVGSAAVDTATGLVQTGEEHFLEVDCPISNTATVVVHLDGNQIYSGTLDTLNVNTSSGGLLFDSSTDTLIRDIYALSVDGTAPETRLGPGRAETVRPTAQGTNNQWLHDDGSAGDSASWDEVNDTDPDTTTYLKSSTVGEKDDFAYADLSGVSGSVAAVCKFLRANKDDTATRILKNLARASGGTELQGSKSHAMAQSADGSVYGWFWDGFNTDPDLNAWTRSLFNSCKWGRIVNT